LMSGMIKLWNWQKRGEEREEKKDQERPYDGTR
jgi:hypothetical protein